MLTEFLAQLCCQRARGVVGGDLPVPSVPGEKVGERHFHSQRNEELV